MMILLIASLAALQSDADDAALMKSDDQAVRRGFTQQRRTVPAPFQGEFRHLLEECGTAAPAAMTIRATRIALPDADADVLSVRVDGQRKITVSSIYENPSEIWEKTETMLLSRDGKRLALVSPAGTSTRVRCPAK